MQYTIYRRREMCLSSEGIQHSSLMFCESLNRVDGRGVSQRGRCSREDPTATVGHSVAEYMFSKQNQVNNLASYVIVKTVA